jgi:2-polyprenyl-3-methyl-5-hydroxy-6-metoxy-1,4-benzoquinol methylase
MSKPTKPVRIENGVVIGTTSDKYTTGNLIVRKLVQNFDAGVQALLCQVNPLTITEIGCGEGHVTEILLQNTQATINAFDISKTIIHEAQANISSPRISFEQKDIYTLCADQHFADLVVCCEVLEHLTDPEAALDLLADLAKPYALLSVPREPLWCTLNILRGTYLKNFGNTPGHLQHWSKRGFLQFVSRRFDILATASPLPWTMVLVRTKTSPPCD